MKGTVVWFTGLPRSGKSTLAEATRARLKVPALVLDGDQVRAALRPTPGYQPQERDAFYATLANLANLLAAQGLTVLVPATAHRRAYREHARAHAPRFVEVHLATPVEECRARDGRGLYADTATRAALPGAGVPYETPIAPEVIARGGRDVRALEALLALLSPVQ